MKSSLSLKMVFAAMILALALGLTACGGDKGNLNKLNGKWSGGIVTIEFDANAKTMSTFFG